MKTQYGFTRFDTLAEFKTWLGKQPKYNYTGLQVHHTYSPSYSNFYKKDGSHEDELTRQYNIKSFHINTNKWGDIAQHFTIFPNGKIVTGRKLSKIQAIGIKGWNANKICIEIYGNFDKGKDNMTEAQKKAVIGLYGELCKKFKLTPSTSTIRPHCWFTDGGTYIGDYSISRSAKTCPGTNFMGIGNTKKSFVNEFYPMIKKYINGESTSKVKEPVQTSKYTTGVYRVNTDDLNIREKATADSKKVGVVHKGDAYTITKISGNWGFLKSQIGWIHLGYCKKV